MSGDKGGMRCILLVAALLSGTSATAAERNYSVTSFDRVRIDGPYQVVLKTGVPPFAKASGSQASLDGLTIRTEGRTLIVRAGSGGWGGYPGEGRGPVTIMVGTHELAAAYINGAGGLVIDKVKGLSFDAALQGPGSIRIDNAQVDQMKVGMSGAGSARLAGKALKLTATVRGTSSFDAEALAVKDAVIGAEGPALVKASVSGTAKVDALGLAAVTLAGRPSCTVKTQGSATVAGCR